jgi:hypothetical protein
MLIKAHTQTPPLYMKSTNYQQIKDYIEMRNNLTRKERKYIREQLRGGIEKEQNPVINILESLN